MILHRPDTFPLIRHVGTDGLLVSFGDKLTEPANRAALAFRAAIEDAGWDGVEETSTSLVSAYLRFDPVHADPAQLTAQLKERLGGADWLQADLPEGRRFFRIPTVYGTDMGPQLAEAAAAAGLSEAKAIRSISETRVRVTTIGFAPGQPYLGELPECWDIPRQQNLTPTVPRGALVVAIRQLVLFSNSTPTGWRHIGQTAFQLFRPDSQTPFVLRPGDEVQFVPTDPEKLNNMQADPDGGAVTEPIR
ncbi:5-oxoprolinase subunit B family protein [Aestuariicoccus sp. MJ-SS9]|uniref:5-oxoprolinase subunit B family protein n=1 Tax=Aestuariicoccus sp. MJ-SS9 TaxID=3079855 RepID=UPI00290AD142|nr:carboxyltransferase domain-containing protein [Aestuariicoccus sp. MJ-SS9]MDU8912986.1 carboxyltransferase domain-containing protein [Aestuariicoccus sp. MJ-SS9]